MPPELCPVRWLGECAVITLPEEVDISSADQVRQELLAVVGRASTVVIVDMSATVFCDSACISALVRAFRRAEAKGCELRLAARYPGVLRVLAIMGVDRLMAVYPAVPLALAGLRSPNSPGPVPRNPDGSRPPFAPPAPPAAGQSPPGSAPAR